MCCVSGVLGCWNQPIEVVRVEVGSPTELEENQLHILTMGDPRLLIPDAISS